MALRVLLISLALTTIHQPIIVMSVRGPECRKIVRLDLGIVSNISHTLDAGVLKALSNSLSSGIKEAFDLATEGVRVALSSCYEKVAFSPDLSRLHAILGLQSNCNVVDTLSWIQQNDNRNGVEDNYLIISTGYNNKSAMDLKWHSMTNLLFFFVLLLDVDDEWTLQSKSAPSFAHEVWIVKPPFTNLMNVVHEMFEIICRRSTHMCQFRQYNVSCSPNPIGSGCVEGHAYNITKKGYSCPNVTHFFTPCTCPTISISSTSSTQLITESRSGPMIYIVIGTIGGILLLIAIAITVILIKRRSTQPKTTIVPPPSRDAPKKRDEKSQSVRADLKTHIDRILPKVKKLTEKGEKSSTSISSSRTSSLPSTSTNKAVASPGSAKKVTRLIIHSKLPTSPTSSYAKQAKMAKT